MIEVGRNSIIVRNVDHDSDDYARVKRAFSLYDKVYHKYTFCAFTEIGNDLYFPASIGVQTLASYFPGKQISMNYASTPTPRNVSYKMKHQPKNELQKKALAFLTAMETDDLDKSRFLSLATGSGKTYISINTISKLGKAAMVVVDTTALADQWKNEFIKHSNLKENDISILSGQEIVDKESENPTAKVYIAIHRTLANMLTKDAGSVNALMATLGIGTRIFDESHTEFANICKVNSMSNVLYTIYLTATPSRSNFMDNSLYAKVFGKVRYFNGKEMGGEKYHAVVIYPMNSKPGLDVKASCRTQYGFSIGKWAAYLTEDGYEYVLETVVGIIDSLGLIKRKKKTAILFPTIALIKKVKDDLEIQYPGIDIGLFIGETKAKERENEKSRSFILTDDKMFGKAIDIPDLEVVINFVDYGSLVKTEQTIGRLRRHEGKSSVYVDVVDNGFDECVKHSKIRKRFYKKNAKSITEINVEKSKGEN